MPPHSSSPPPSRVCFCLSKARESAPPQPLLALKMSQLRQLAVDGGALSKQLAAAEDDPLPKQAMITLIEGLAPDAHAEPRRSEAVAALRAELVTCAPSVLEDTAASASDRAQSLRAELEGLKVSALKKRAASSGVAPEALLDADDADDVKGSVIDLILRAEGVGGA